MEKNEPLYLRISEFINANVEGCSFVGVTDDGEVLVAFSNSVDTERVGVGALLIRDSFEELNKVTIVEKLDITQAKEMITDLNKMLETKEKPAGPLLNIGKF